MLSLREKGIGLKIHLQFPIAGDSNLEHDAFYLQHFSDFRWHSWKDAFLANLILVSFSFPSPQFFLSLYFLYSSCASSVYHSLLLSKSLFPQFFLSSILSSCSLNLDIGGSWPPTTHTFLLFPKNDLDFITGGTPQCGLMPFHPICRFVASFPDPSYCLWPLRKKGFYI